MSVKNVTDEMVVKAVNDFRKSGMCGPYPYEALANLTGECEKVCYRAMERAERHGLIEYGVSLRTGWLTDKGIDLLGRENVA